MQVELCLMIRMRRTVIIIIIITTTITTKTTIKHRFTILTKCNLVRDIGIKKKFFLIKIMGTILEVTRADIGS